MPGTTRPRTVWGSRRFMLGRYPAITEYHLTSEWDSASSFMSEGLRDQYLRLFEAGRYEMIPEEWLDITERQDKWMVANDILYYGMQMSRTAYWYAKQTGVLDNIDPGISSRLELGLGVATQAMGIGATTVYALGAFGAGNIAGGVLAISSIPIQLAGIAELVTQWLHEEEIRIYNDHREKFLARQLIGKG